jgi:NTP pyrophosphatase (non-canonical NTP hydrolase)
MTLSVADVQAAILKWALAVASLGPCVLPKKEKGHGAQCMRDCLLGAIGICRQCGYPFLLVLKRKMELNRKKYIPGLCRERSDIMKYTVDSHVSGVGEAENKNKQVVFAEDPIGAREDVHSLDSAARELWEFANERNWLSKYNETSLMLSIHTEMGELCEVLQWADGRLDFGTIAHDKKNQLASEIADVTLYLLHLCRVMGWDREMWGSHNSS